MTQEQFQDALNARVSTIKKDIVRAMPKNITMQKTIALAEKALYGQDLT